MAIFLKGGIKNEVKVWQRDWVSLRATIKKDDRLKKELTKHRVSFLYQEVNRRIREKESFLS